MKKIDFEGTEITFDDLEYQRLDDCFECRGYDDKGNIYSGLISKSCGEYGDITDIEKVEDNSPAFNFDNDPPIMVGDPYQSHI